jgi:7-cyano-7-deazaguanine synthase
VKSVILLSGGLDSTVCLKKAVDESAAFLALTFDYGQKAAPREIEAARKICSLYSVPHRVISLPFFAGLGNCALTSSKRNVPEFAPDERDMKSLWVPNRNGVFVNIGACFAEALGCDTVVAGFNLDEARLFPDNSTEFIDAANRSFQFSTLSGVRLFSYTAHLSKKEIVALGRAIGAPIELTWSCYESGENQCGKCRSCKVTLQALTGQKI